MTDHPIIALWAHPRSMSTATERVARTRGDLDCAHEPFMYDYYVHRRAGHTPHFDVQPDHPTRYSSIRDMLLERAGRGPVFFKDMAYYVLPYLPEDAAFAARLRHVFLVRDPHAALASYHGLDADFTCEEAGIEAQWRLFEALEGMGHAPLVLRSEDIRANPAAMMRALWDHAELADAPGALNWDGPPPEDWAQVSAWHAAATGSTSIRPMAADHAERAIARFEAAAEVTPRLREVLAHHQPFYERLCARAFRP
ncbi:hypothetical protein KUD11_10255 [Roseovarius sp. LXJ103]|uniref:sulfotransferase-like domain-containing protein n=1 Tax=Roseovarius carneus TaxID=2853164 RepID=UPI000D6225A2|nr:hypothetical protein [Roseovarius carneus]MBZ8119028.1 hypothetical protein [Roseovarius carneus]PWE35323.1 hypothetical protein DD563_04700 [Pelagicola sp. LXJ1103]